MTVICEHAETCNARGYCTSAKEHEPHQNGERVCTDPSFCFNTKTDVKCVEKKVDDCK